MIDATSGGTTLRRSLLAALALPALLAAGAAAHAGECPADKTGIDLTKPVSTPAKDVTDTVISAIDLAPKGDAWAGNMLRLRKLVVQPGGIVPWHSHEVRPANILVVEGSITEYRSTCKVPIEHPAGDVTSEFGKLSHWWKNNGKVPAVLIAADIKNDGAAPDGDHM